MKFFNKALGSLLIGFFGTIAIAQIESISAPDQMRLAVGSSMGRVCIVDNDSRQCELFQFLFGEQSSSLGILAGSLDSKTRSEVLRASDGRKEQLSEMEAQNKLKLTKMYGALKQAQERLCAIKFESKPCDTALSIFIIQTDIEVGKRFNPPPEVSQQVKINIRKMIANEQPDLSESSKRALEASVLWEMKHPKQ